MINITKLSHDLLKEVKNADISVDMTCGNGLDTLFLSKQSKKVYAFDIQELAINNTSKLLEDNQIENVEIIKDSHENIDCYITKKVDQVIYNLGYLPKGNKEIKTNAQVVLSSLKKVIKLLNDSGIIIMVIYLHDLEESNQITSYVSTLDKTFDVMKFEVLNKEYSPYIIKIKKLEG